MTRPTIIIAGNPEWVDAVRDQLCDDYTVEVYSERAAYVSRLTDARAALIIVDGENEGWRFWTLTPRGSNATRRIPIIFISQQAQARDESLALGADLALRSAEMLKQVKRLVADYARVASPEQIEELTRACQEPLPPKALQGVEQFNAREYYAQHDIFEALWMETTGLVRELYRAILQVGVAYYQIERGNYRGAVKMLLHSVQWLSMLPAVCQGVDVKALCEDSYHVRAELVRLGEKNIGLFDKSLLKPLKLIAGGG